MTGTLAQIITLTTFGNEFLRNNNIPGDFEKNNSFTFCNRIDFRIFKKTLFFNQKEVIVAETPKLWFGYLKNTGCRKLRLYFQHSQQQSIAKDYKLAGLVGGGGLWIIEAIYDNYSDAWASRWEVTQKDDPNNNIWTVNYGRTAHKAETVDVQIDINKAKQDLHETLIKISAFALRHNLEYWHNQFQQALSALDSLHSENNYYNRQLIPLQNYSLPAQQTLFGAAIAWVFGAMGSWNDLGFETDEDNALYEELSESLYNNVNIAIIAAANSY